MKAAWKGALLSAMVVPGLGQLVLKRTLRGLAVMAATLAGMVLFVVKATAIAVQALEGPIGSAGVPDMTAVNAAAAQAVASADGLVMRGALLWIVVCWVLATADAYFIGKKLDEDA